QPVRSPEQQAGGGDATADADQHQPVAAPETAAREQQAPGGQPRQRQGGRFLEREMRWSRMADGRRYDQRILKGAVGMLAQDGHLRTVDLLSRLARRTVTARDDRVQDDLVALQYVVYTLADGIDDA